MSYICYDRDVSICRQGIPCDTWNATYPWERRCIQCVNVEVPLNNCCINGLGTCTDCQSFCEVGTEMATDHANNPLDGKCFSRGEIIIKNFSKADMQAVFDFLKEVLEKGDVKDTSDFNANIQSGDFLKAADYNAIAQALQKLGQSIPSGFGRDTIIKGEYFEKMKNAIDNGKLDKKACDKCNEKCDTRCDECQNYDEATSLWPPCTAQYDMNDRVVYPNGLVQTVCKACNTGQCSMSCENCNTGNTG